MFKLIKYIICRCEELGLQIGLADFSSHIWPGWDQTEQFAIQFRAAWNHLYALNCVYSRLIWYRVLNLIVIWNSFPHQSLIPEQWKASLTMHLPLKINSFICWGILCLHFYLLTKLVYVLISVFVVTFCGFLFAIGSSENVWPEPR